MSDLQQLYDRLLARQAACETILAMTVGRFLRSVGSDLRTELIRELRSCVAVNVTGVSDPARAAHMALQAEEDVARLLDQIERTARSENGASRHSSVKRARKSR
jgi:hypothetical protein